MIPKTIFIYWHDSNLPNVLKINLKKIKTNNPEYKVVLLNKITYKKYVNFESYNFNFNDKLLNTEAYFSDILRIFLLSEYGGIWIDASLILWKNLNKLIDKNDKLVLFRNFDNDNGINNCGFESWFIASQPKNPFILEIKNQIIKLNTYKKIKEYLLIIKKDKIKIQKNVNKEYHLIYHIFSYVQQKYPKKIGIYKFHDASIAYLNNWFPGFYINKHINTYVFNFNVVFDLYRSLNIISFLENGEPEYLILSKITKNTRNLFEIIKNKKSKSILNIILKIILYLIKIDF